MLQRGIIRNVVIVIRYSIKKSAHNIRLTMISNDIALWLYHYMMYDLYQWYSYMSGFFKYIWRPPSLSELTPETLNMGLTYLGSEAYIYGVYIT